MSARKKLGRPTDNPKTAPIHVRLDKETESILNKYCTQEKVTRAEGVRRGKSNRRKQNAMIIYAERRL